MAKWTLFNTFWATLLMRLLNTFQQVFNRYVLSHVHVVEVVWVPKGVAHKVFKGVYLTLLFSFNGFASWLPFLWDLFRKRADAK